MLVALRLQTLLATLRRSLLRSVTAAGSVGLGIASLSVMLALSAGADRQLRSITERVGKNLLTIRASEIQAPPGRGSGWFPATTLTLRDVAFLAQQVADIQSIAPIAEANLRVQLDREELNTNVRGVPPEFLGLRNFRLRAGRSLDDLDGSAVSRVAIVGPFVAQRLNAGHSLVGETVWISGVAFDVVGQLEEKGLSEDGTNEDDQILIPLQTALKRVLNIDYLSRALVQVRDESRMPAVEREARRLLRDEHNLDPGARD